MLSLYADRFPGAHVLEGHYIIIQHAIATPKGKVAAAGYVRSFVEEAKINGLVVEAIRAAGSAANSSGSSFASEMMSNVVSIGRSSTVTLSTPALHVPHSSG